LIGKGGKIMDRRARRRTARAFQRGMTLIEIMVVVAIIGMLMGAVAIGTMKSFKKAKVTDTKMVIKTVGTALEHFKTDSQDACPKSVSDLYTQKYLTKEPLDAWGQQLIFKCPGDHDPDGADIVSKGEDKQEGTADDIKSWEL
jgi:general secretion pathway protein G